MKIKEVSKLANISIRTLHYYDEINLLKPSSINSSGYRNYDEKNLEKLHKIMFLKEMDFSLLEIKEILNNDDYIPIFRNKKQILTAKNNRLERIINSIDKYLKGDLQMDFDIFDMSEIEDAKNKYEKETKEKWGNTLAYKQSKENTDSYSNKQWEIITNENKEIFNTFASIRELKPNCKKAQRLVEKWKNFINKYYYDCDNEILHNLASLYINDERFKNNIDKYGKGTAIFISEAIKYYFRKE